MAKKQLSKERHREIGALIKEIRYQLGSMAVEFRKCDRGKKAANRLVKAVDYLDDFKIEARLLGEIAFPRDFEHDIY
jgi:hypothetical protein